ncbi:phosphoglucosamine mutase [Litorimonas sp. RW-G-Af-16]|uniref:phosphoglucosamine mutase n=1 Tax=Litorimonas sp. RW-G-Af-16 TaxID=3241168 RepID=UPI00390CC3B8
MAKKKFFGTDGVRGRANIGKMTPQKVMRLGQAAGTYFRKTQPRRPSVVIGKDTRLSGYMIEPALVAGFTSVGMDVKLTGPIPTSAVSLLTRTLRADMGVMITASHNQFADNGIKFFGPDGRKLSDEAEHEIESFLAEDERGLAESEDLGRVVRYEDMQARYIEIVKASFPRRMRLSGLKIVIDCANGAAYKTAPAALWELGADEVIPIGVAPNGKNINQDCGSTHTDLLAKTVVEQGAHLGIALDGDADRLIMCDETGRIVDGDQLLALIGSGWHVKGQLSRPGIVATVMSNLGLERFIQDRNLEFIRTDVGDRHVAARMRADGYNVGGEQSGHILMTDFTPTGDGTVAALQILAEIIRSGKPASETLNLFEPVPQLLKNVRYSGQSPLEMKDVQAAINDAQAMFGNSGRVLVRASGTEPLIRVMAEGDDAGKVETITDDLVALIAKLAA